jgi:UDP-N-acetylmuramoyl-L-alanyl-D-glutamate--2,6-diaminopimelate ligase
MIIIASMKKILRKLIPRLFINNFYHLPEAIVANLRFGFPGRKVKVIGVTGTDGKTTTTNMIYKILKDAGKKVSMVSTINAVVGDEVLDTGFHVTSPGRFAVQRLLKKAREDNADYVVLEVTSHAIDQYRFWGINFDIGVITNITHEHLDYHKTFKNYFNTKSRLIKNVKVAVLNRDENHYSVLAKKTKGKILSFGMKNKADYNPKTFPLKLRLPGEYNMLNGLAASAVAQSLGIPRLQIQKSLSSFNGLKGRMEQISNKKGLKIVVDFAHTPNALEQALKTLKKGKTGKIISLIGAEGERDVKKRPMLGEIAQRYSDIVIITSVDPRGQLENINNQIIQGCCRVGGRRDKSFFVIDDREAAITAAINRFAMKGDTIGIFGKGHEVSMNLDGKKEIPWSDQDTVRKVLG